MLPLIGVVDVLFLLLGMPASLLLVWGAGEQFTCKSCASTLLRSQWQATALPNIPPADRFYFDDNCEKNEEVHEVECPSSMCMEMLLVAGGEYTIVRGCLSDFYQGYTLPINSAKCYYAEYSQNITMINNKEPAVIQRPLVGTRYCIESNCNNDLVASYDLAINRKSWQGKKFCDTTSQMQVFQCLNCNRFDYKGDCDWDYRQYCDGEWCTKTMGYVNGRWVATRGCAPINPSGNQLCVKLDSTHEISQLSNQHVNLEYSIEQCFCQGQHCNAAIGRGATGGLVFGLAITVVSGVVRIWAEEKFL